MKKTLIIGLVTILSLVLTYGFADAAAVTGVCSNCHVMHASEGGTAAASQYNYLARNTCIGCHIGTTYSSLGVSTDRTTNSATDGMTAAGTLNVSVATAPNMRHDVAGFSGHTAVTAVVGKYGLTLAFTGDLTCAGNKGCHGVHNATGDAGISGYHHGSKAGYRFLHIGTAAYAAGTAVVGGSALVREMGTTGATATNHNVYSASATQGISLFCANCHGTFHGTSNTNSASPFIRHPTDRLLGTGGAAWTLASVDANISDPYNTTPFAFEPYTTVTIGQAYTAVTPGTGQVACVSCHRAHGSANASNLRYSYTTISAGNATNNGGCENCHYKQR